MSNSTLPNGPTESGSLQLRLGDPGIWWVLALDGRHARLLVREALHAPFGERAGVVDVAANGDPIAPHDFGHHHGRYEKNERQFVEQVARRLEELALAGRFDHLVVLAAPIALGVLRPALGPHTRRRLVHVEAKDLAGRPAREIAAFLARA